MARMTCPNNGCKRMLYPTIEWNEDKSVLMMRFICGDCGVVITVVYESLFGEALDME